MLRNIFFGLLSAGIFVSCSTDTTAPGNQGSVNEADLIRAIEIGAVERVRPKMMTVTAIMAGLLPIMWGHGSGSQVMKRIATPMIGGMVSSTILTLIVIPAIYLVWRRRELAQTRAGAQSDGAVAADT